MNKKDLRNNELQALCRKYLLKLRYMASKYGLAHFIDETIKLNKRGECSGTEYECEMLARMCNDERVSRIDVPKILNKPYKQCFDDDDFGKIKKLPRIGIYSKVSAMLYNAQQNKNKNGSNTKT